MNAAHKQLLALWLFSTLLILCRTANWMTDSLAIAACEGIPTLATPDAWTVPWARWPELIRWLQWPGVIYAVAAGLLLSRIVPVRSPAWASLLGLIGLSLLCSPQHLIPAFWISQLSFGSANTGRWKPLLVLGFAVLTTLEFGLIALLVTVALWARPAERGSWNSRLVPVAIGAAAIAGAIVLWPGFGRTLARPLIALFFNPPEEMMTSLRTLSGLREFWLSWGCLLPLLLGTGRALGQKSAPAWRIITWCLLLVCGASCSRYSFLAAVGMLRLAGEAATPASPERRFGPTFATAILGAAITLGLTMSGRFFPSRLSQNERFQLERWDTQGIVALLNLERSSEWQTPMTIERFPLMASDRWELCHERLPDYHKFCQDITEGREHRYLRRDNTFGGYKLWTRDQSVAFLALEASDVDSIRRISVSPDWRIVGIDAEQVLFGNSAITANRMLIRQASEELLACEWKGKTPVGDGAIVIGRQSSRPTLAAVICSIKYPYAALNLLTEVPGSKAEQVRASCLMELSHRVAGHASQLSLLDHYRAQVKVTRVLSEGVDSDLRLRLTRGMGALDSRMPEVDESAPVELQLRSALLSGQTALAEELLPRIPESLRSYYSVVIESIDLPSEELYSRLLTAAQTLSGDIPAETASEAWFYAGCAALEARQPAAATEAFHTSERIGPESKLYQIRNLYLRQTLR